MTNVRKQKLMKVVGVMESDLRLLPLSEAFVQISIFSTNRQNVVEQVVTAVSVIQHLER